MNDRTVRAIRVAVWLFAGGSVTAGLVAQELPPSPFPLDAGNSWLYRIRGIEEFDPEVVPWDMETWRIEVLSREGAVATVRYVYATLRTVLVSRDVVLLDRGEEIDILGEFVEGNCRIEAPDPDEFVLHYGFGQESFVHRAWETCRDGMMIRVHPVEERVSARSGDFSDCKLLEFPFPPCCFDSLERLTETWCPGVGLVLFRDNTGGQFPGYALSEFDFAYFQRGDATADGEFEITDAVAVLNHLFLGSEAPACLDAADADDSGDVNITDPILVLSVLFLGGAALPEPAGECGYDPRPDGLGRCVFAACEDVEDP